MADRSDNQGSAAQVDRTARLFAAVWLPPAVTAELSAHLDSCWGAVNGNPPSSSTNWGDEPTPTESPAARLRRTRPDTWHVTLAFLGEAPLARSVRRFRGSSREGAQDDGLPAAGSLQLAGAGSFGPAVWVGLAHEGWLTKLAEVMQRRLAVPDRRFQAHVTVGRVRVASRAPEQGNPRARGGGNVAMNTLITNAVSAIGDWRGPSWTPTEVVLVESVLGPNPRYPVQASLPL